MADPTLFVAATASAERAFGGVHAALSVQFFPHPVLLFFVYVQRGRGARVVGAPNVIYR